MINLAQIRWWLRTRGQQLSYMQLVIVALLGLVIAVQWRVLTPLQQQLLRQQQAISEAKQRLMAVSPSTTLPVIASTTSTSANEKTKTRTLTTPPTLSIEQQFKAFLPPVSQRQHDLLALQQLATQQQLQITEISYQHQQTPLLHLAQTQLRFNLIGTESALMTFLGSLLAQYPHLAISRLSIEQAENGLANQQRLTLELQLWFRPQEAS